MAVGPPTARAGLRGHAFHREVVPGCPRTLAHPSAGPNLCWAIGAIGLSD